LRARELKRVLGAENETAVAQRLGFVIEACGNKPLAKVVRDWLPDELTPVTLAPARGTRDKLPLVKRWQVLNNSAELKVRRSPARICWRTKPLCRGGAQYQVEQDLLLCRAMVALFDDKFLSS
jgi:hypothetical protein